MSVRLSGAKILEAMVAPKIGLGDGHYYNIDWGYFVVRDKVAYFPDGEFLDTTIHQPARWFPFDPKIVACPEDYSAWDDDRRCLEQSIRQAEIEAAEENQADWHNKRKVLVESAKTKLTQDEFNAVFEAGMQEERR